MVQWYTLGHRQASASVACHWPAVQCKMSHLRRFPVNCHCFSDLGLSIETGPKEVPYKSPCWLGSNYKFFTEVECKVPPHFCSLVSHSECEKLTVKTNQYHIFSQTQIMPLVLFCIHIKWLAEPFPNSWFNHFNPPFVDNPVVHSSLSKYPHDFPVTIYTNIIKHPHVLETVLRYGDMDGHRGIYIYISI